MAGKLMEGITARTKKQTIMARLQQADEQLEHMQTIASVRRKWRSQNPEQQQTLVVTASEQDWLDMLEFLHDLSDVLPPALARLYNGGREMWAQNLTEDDEEATEN